MDATIHLDPTPAGTFVNETQKRTSWYPVLKLLVRKRATGPWTWIGHIRIYPGQYALWLNYGLNSQGGIPITQLGSRLFSQDEGYVYYLSPTM